MKMNAAIKEIKLEEHMNLAREALARGEFLSAFAISKSVLSREDEVTEALSIMLEAQLGIFQQKSHVSRMLGYFYYMWSRLKYYFCPESDKIAHIQKMLDLRPLSSRGLMLLGDAFAEKGLYRGVTVVYEKLVKLFPDSVEIGLSLVDSYLVLQRFEDAIALGERVLAKNPGSARALNLVHQAAVDLAMNGGVSLNSKDRT